MRLPRASALGVLAALAAVGPACSDRTQPSSNVGRRLAEHLCPIQAACGCDEALLIPSCESTVEHEVVAIEREALAAGLELDEACIEDLLADVDALGTCEDVDMGPPCPVYTAHAEVGEPCEIFAFLPWATHCRAGLSCIQGKCEDLLDPHLLYEGEVCTDDDAGNDPGQCAEGLTCDASDTRTCVPSPYWPPVPTGGVCTHPFLCIEGSYCRPNDLDDPDAPSEESPGICTPLSAEGQPCSYALECTTQCLDGFCEVWPPTMCGVLEAWSSREML